MIPVSEYAIDNTSQADVDGHVVHAPSASQDEEPSEEAAKDELTSFTGAQVDHMAHSLDQLDDSSVLFWGDEAKCSDSVHEFLSQQFCEEHDNAEHSQHSSSAGVEHNGHCGTTSSPCLEPHPGDLGQCSPSIVELGHSGPEDPFAHPSTESTSYEPGHQPSSVIVAKSHVDHGHSTLPSVSTSIERRDDGPASPPSRVYQIQGISDHRSLSNSRAGDVRDFPSLTTIQEHHHDSGHLSIPPSLPDFSPPSYSLLDNFAGSQESYESELWNASDLNFKYTSSSGSSDQFDSPHSRERCVVSMLDAYDRGRYIFPDGNMNTLEIPGNSKTIATQSTILMPAGSRPAMRTFERSKQPMFHANQHVAPPGIMQLPPSNEPFVLQNTRYFQPHPGDGPFPYQAGAEFPSQISAPPFINRRLPMPSGSHQNMLTAYSRMPSFTLLHRGALSGDPSAPIPPVPAVLPGRYQQAFYQTGSHIAVPGPTRYAFPMQPPFMDNIPDPAASWSSRPLQKSLSFHPYHKPDTSGSDESHLSDFHMDLWLSGYHLDPSSPTDIVRCRWKDCVAEMEAKDVVNHVMKVHCRNDGSNKIHCLWVKCGKQRQKGSMHGHVQNVHVGLDHVRCKFCGLRTKKTNKSHAKSCLRKVIFYKPIREQVAGWAAPDGASEEIII